MLPVWDEPSLRIGYVAHSASKLGRCASDWKKALYRSSVMLSMTSLGIALSRSATKTLTTLLFSICSLVMSQACDIIDHFYFSTVMISQMILYVVELTALSILNFRECRLK